jgi:hypothetical protein
MLQRSPGSREDKSVSSRHVAQGTFASEPPSPPSAPAASAATPPIPEFVMPLAVDDDRLDAAHGDHFAIAKSAVLIRRS